jgi:hypothetical protein
MSELTLGEQREWSSRCDRFVFRRAKGDFFPSSNKRFQSGSDRHCESSKTIGGSAKPSPVVRFLAENGAERSQASGPIVGDVTKPSHCRQGGMASWDPEIDDEMISRRARGLG